MQLVYNGEETTFFNMLVDLVGQLKNNDNEMFETHLEEVRKKNKIILGYQLFIVKEKSLGVPNVEIGKNRRRIFWSGENLPQDRKNGILSGEVNAQGEDLIIEDACVADYVFFFPENQIDQIKATLTMEKILENSISVDECAKNTPLYLSFRKVNLDLETKRYKNRDIWVEVQYPTDGSPTPVLLSNIGEINTSKASNYVHKP